MAHRHELLARVLDVLIPVCVHVGWFDSSSQACWGVYLYAICLYVSGCPEFHLFFQ